METYMYTYDKLAPTSWPAYPNLVAYSQQASKSMADAKASEKKGRLELYI